MVKTLYSESEDLGFRTHFSDFSTSIHSILGKSNDILGLVNYKWRRNCGPICWSQGNCVSQAFKNYYYNQLINLTN